MKFWQLVITQFAIAGISIVNGATVYTDRSAWEAAVWSFGTETFDNPIPNATVIVFANGVTATGIGGTLANDVLSGVNRSDIDTSHEFPDHFQQIVWTFPFPVIGFGADFFSAADGTGLLLTGVFDGISPQSVSLLSTLGDPGTGFVGIVGKAPFTSVTLSEEFAERNGIGAEGYFLDNLSLAPVPEPSTLASIGLVICLGAARRIKQ